MIDGPAPGPGGAVPSPPPGPGPRPGPGTDPVFGRTLEPGRRPALLVVDLVQAYFTAGSPLDLGDTGVLAVARRVLDAARAAGVPVVHTQVRYAADGRDGGVFYRKLSGALSVLVEGSPLGEPAPATAPGPAELVVVKQYASAFFGTSLTSTLHALGVDTVVVVGVSTSGCIRATAVDACQHGFVPLVVADAVADRTAAVHDANLFDLQAKYAEVVDAATAVGYLTDCAADDLKQQRR